MPHLPDATAKYAFDRDPAAWLAVAGILIAASAARVTLLDPHMPTVSMTADKLILVDDSVLGRFLVHVEFQTVRDPALDLRMLRYNVWATEKYGLPVRSVAFLFRPAAAAGVTGLVHAGTGDGWLLDFRYTVVRLYELPAELLVGGPIATIGLAGVAVIPPGEAGQTATRIRDRLVSELPPAEAREMAEVLRVFAGLRPGRTFLEKVMMTLSDLYEASTSYRETVDRSKAAGKAEGKAEGKADGERTMLLRMGAARFGPPSAAAAARVAAASSADLDRIAARLLSAAGWEDLLGGG